MAEQLPLWPQRMLPFGAHAGLNEVPPLTFIGVAEDGLPLHEVHEHCTCEFREDGTA